MNAVEPIRDIEVVHDIADYLRIRSERDYIMFMFGVYSGLRISDILKLRVRDVRGKEKVTLREKKTGKERRFPINKALKKALAKYIEAMRDYEFLFKSRNGNNQPITRQQAWSILNKAGKEFGIDRIGTHTLRKTFGYHMYMQTHNIALIQKILNHSSADITMVYIGVTQDAMDSAMDKLDFGM